MKCNRRAVCLAVCTVLWMVFIFGHSMQNAARSSQESGWVLNAVRGIFPFVSEYFLRKLGHFSEFFLLGLLLAATARQLRWSAVMLPLLSGLLTALTDETIQLFSEGRAAMVQDVWIDFSGVAAAVLLAALLRRFRRNWRKS